MQKFAKQNCQNDWSCKVSIYFEIYDVKYLLFSKNSIQFLKHHISKPLQKTPSRSGDNFK